GWLCAPDQAGGEKEHQHARQGSKVFRSSVPVKVSRLRCPKMDERLEDFAGLLRQNGLRISPAEVADAAQATILVGLEDRATFRGALRATLVKRGQDAPVFDRLFELFFTGVKDLLEGLQGSLLDAL